MLVRDGNQHRLSWFWQSQASHFGSRLSCSTTQAQRQNQQTMIVSRFRISQSKRSLSMSHPSRSPYQALRSTWAGAQGRQAGTLSPQRRRVARLRQDARPFVCREAITISRHIRKKKTTWQLDRRCKILRSGSERIILWHRSTSRLRKRKRAASSKSWYVLTNSDSEPCNAVHFLQLQRAVFLLEKGPFSYLALLSST